MPGHIRNLWEQGLQEYLKHTVGEFQVNICTLTYPFSPC